MKRSIAALGAALVLIHPASALAHHPGGPGNSGGSGPINTISASTLAAGSGVFGIVVDHTSLDALSDATLSAAAVEAASAGEDHAHVHSLDALRSTSLNLAYGITNELMVAVRLPHIVRTDIREGHAHEHAPGDFEGEVHALGDSSGIGDLSLLAQWRFLQNSGLEIAALGGFKAPTGKTSEKNEEGETFDAEFQPGSGSWDGLFGLAVTKRYQAWSVDASALYTVVTEGTQNTDLGDRFNYGFAVSYRAFGEAPHTHADGTVETHGSAVDLILELNGEWHDKQAEGGEDDDNSGGHVLYIAPGVRYANDKFSAFASVGLPIVNDLNGIQAEPDWRLVSGVSLGF
jgi:hypothetical protein